LELQRQQNDRQYSLELQRQQGQQGQPRTPATQHVSGKYKLKNYKVQYSNGQVLTENDVKLSGDLEIRDKAVKVAVTLGNQTSKGEGDIVNQNGTSGTYAFKTESNKGSGDFTISDDNSITLHTKSIQDNKEVESWATWARYGD
jgi:hypothetical protein